MGDFALDRAKMMSIAFGSDRPPIRSRLKLYLLSSELHCVAAYRFGRYAAELRARRGAMAIPLIVVHRLWNRWNTHIHHCDIDRTAVIGPGLLLMHRQGIIIGPVVLGVNSVIHHNVTIGQRVAAADQGVPHIGDDVWIGTGAILVGAITVGSGATISAGSVVSRDVPERSLVAGNPGRVIATDYDNSTMINFAMPGAQARHTS